MCLLQKSRKLGLDIDIQNLGQACDADLFVHEVFSFR